MTRINATLDANQSGNPAPNYAVCPECKQKLMDVKEFKGYGTFRIKCRRCGKFINVEIVGVE